MADCACANSPDGYSRGDLKLWGRKCRCREEDRIELRCSAANRCSSEHAEESVAGGSHAFVISPKKTVSRVCQWTRIHTLQILVRPAYAVIKRASEAMAE